MRSKIIYYLLSLLLLSAVAVLGYFSYMGFQNYQTAQKTHAFIRLAEKTDKSIQGITKEMVSSAHYFGGKNESALAALRKDRSAFDVSLDGLNQMIGQEKDFDSYAALIQTIPRTIAETRAGIDALSGDYETHFESSYHKGVVGHFLKIIKALPKSIAEGMLKKEIQYFAEVEESIARIGSEASLLLYLAAGKSKVDDGQMKLMESFVSHELFPPLEWVANSEVSKLLSVDGQENAIEEIRVTILEHALDGKYTVSDKYIADTYNALLGRLYAAQTILSKDMEQGLNKNLKNIKQEMMQYAVTMLFALVALFFLYRTFSSRAEEKKELEKALRGMVSHLDKVQQQELDAIIKRGDTVAIYRFLSRATQGAHRAREQAIQAEKAKDLFLANMSHEIRTPLNGILGFTQLLSDTGLNGEQREFLDVVKVSSDNLLKIVNDILDLSKIKANKMDLEYISFNAVNVLIEAVEPHEIMATDKKIEYTTFIDPTLPSLLGDPTKLSQVMTNLIGNAMKFTNHLGKVEVNIEKLDEAQDSLTLRFSVKDSGLGISDEQREHIFQAFSQADISTTRKFGGTGLGLTITSTLVEKMGGTLEVESEVGKGTEFYFVLTFEKSAVNEIPLRSFEGLSVGYFKPKGTPEKKIEFNLRRYMEALDVSFEEFNTIDEKVIGGYDSIVVDYSFAEVRDNLDMIAHMAKCTIVLTYISYNNEAKAIEDKVDAIIYKPLNVVKISKSLEELTKNTPTNEAEAITTKKPLADKPSFKNRNILAVEDNIINQKLISRIIKNLGADIDIANNGQEAVEMRQKKPYDLVLMDIQMPVLGGIEATEKIIAWERESGEVHVPIVALTANALRGDKEKYLAAGMDDYLSKPIDIAHLKKIFFQHYPAESPERERGLKEAPTEEMAEDGTVQEQQEVPSNIVEQAVEKGGHGEEEDVLKSNKAPVEIMSTGEILILGGSRLVQKIHQSILENLGYKVDLLDATEYFLETVEQKEYSHVLVHAAMLDADICMVLEALSEMGTIPLVLSGEQRRHCPDMPSYHSFEELRSYL